MTLKILVLLLVIFILIKTYKLRNNFKKKITLLLCFSILVSCFDSNFLKYTSIISYLFALLWVIYIGLTLNYLKKIEKINFILLGLFSITGLLFSLMHWPYANNISIAMIIPILLYFYTSLKTKLKFNKEYLFLNIIAFDCILRFIKLF